MTEQLNALLAVALLGFIAWLGGGRKWAFRTLLATIVLAVLGTIGILLNGYWKDKTSEHRAQMLHDCAIAKIADQKCEEDPLGSGSFFVCPAYTLADNASPQQEEQALAIAEQECRGEMDPRDKSLHEQIIRYRNEHAGAKEDSGARKQKQSRDRFVENAPKTANKSKIDWDYYAQLDPQGCAARIRNAYPHVYDDLDDETLAKKVTAKYPDYCNVKLRLDSK